MADFTSIGTGGGLDWNDPASWTAGVDYPIPGTTTAEIVGGDALHLNIDADLTGAVTITLGTLDIQTSITVGVVPVGLTIILNDGTVTSNLGTITTNSATGIVTTNEAATGLVTTNNGAISVNDGTVTTNNAMASVSQNQGLIVTNKGSVNNYDGTIDDNQLGALVFQIGNTSGTVSLNNGSIYLYDTSTEIIVNGAGTGIIGISPSGVVPAVTNVRDTVVYDGATKMGTVVIPAVTDVKAGVTFDTASVGTLVAGSGILII